MKKNTLKIALPVKAWMWVREPDSFGVERGSWGAAGARVAQARCEGVSPLLPIPAQEPVISE